MVALNAPLLGLLVATTASTLVSVEVAAETERRAPTPAEQAVIAGTIDLCFAPPRTTAEATARLVSLGWTNDETDADPDDGTPATIEAMVGPVMTSNFRRHDIEYTVSNAIFMAASVLGNSSFAQNQVGVRYGEVSLAFLGIDEERPYCAMSGPWWIVRAANQAGLRPQAVQSSADLAQEMGQDNRGTYNIGTLQDFDGFLASVVDVFDEETNVDEVTATLRPASLVVVPRVTLERRAQ